MRGLLLDGERKSIEPLASRVPEGNVQAMQQLVGQSPWDWLPIWELLGKRMTAELEPDSVWVIDDTGFPKQGEHSVGVERQYSGTLGKERQLPSGGERAPCGRARTAPSWAGACICRRAGRRMRQRREEAGIPARCAVPDEVATGVWTLLIESRGWGLADADCGVADAGVRGSDRVSRRAGSSPTSVCRGDFLDLGGMDQAADRDGSTPAARGRGAPADASIDYGEAASYARCGRWLGRHEGGRQVRWRRRHQGMAGVALRGDAGYSHRMGTSRRRTAA